MILNYWTYQTTVCLLEGQTKSNCKKKLISQLSKLPYLKIKNISLRLSKKKIQSNIETQLFNKIRLSRKKVISHESY